MRHWLFVLAAFGIGWAATHTLSWRSRTDIGGAAITTSTHGAPRLCAGGLESALDVEVLPERVNTSSRGEALELRLKLTGRFRRRAFVRHAIELVDDRGREILPARISDIETLAQAEETREFRLTTPEELPDGFYQLRVTAVGADDEQDASEIVELYLRVRQGGVEQMSSDEWFGESRANEGVPL